MAPLVYLSFRKVLLIIYLVLFVHASAFICAFSETHDDQQQQLQSSRKEITLGRRRILADFFVEEEEAVAVEKQKPKKKSTSTSTATTSSPSNKNQTKLTKQPNLSATKNQTKLIKSSTTTTTKLSSSSSSPSSPNQPRTTKSSSSSTKNNQTKPLKTTTTSTKTPTLAGSLSKSDLKKLNSTSKAPKSSSNSTKLDSLISTTKKKPYLDPLKPTTPTNKQNQNKDTTKKQKKPTQPSWIEDEGNYQDLVSEFRDLPIKFQQTLLPDLERISTTSKAYIDKYNREITKKYFNPIVGNKYAPTIASIVSFAFILVSLLLVSLVFNHFKAYFSLQKIIIFVQVYLSIYFTILCLASLVTGLEPLKFLYATSRSTYICLQVLQTLGYILYLLILLMYLVLVFSTDCGLGTRLLGLAQIFVGFAVGLHYYVSVFHRVVHHQPPKTNWKIHSIYATCFLVICLFNRAERRKKAYLEDGGEEGKKS
ncbi:hypothetical protein ACOSQ2_022036 [Xanthoceras sorbifolium]